jgi:hypothetical protein
VSKFKNETLEIQRNKIEFTIAMAIYDFLPIDMGTNANVTMLLTSAEKSG